MEVVVVFADTYARDDILSRGPMLSEYRSNTNKPTAGIRLEIPGHLMGSFKTLEAFGFALKRRHGDEFKKHIKFDEYAGNLFIQAGIKKGEEAVQWTSYTVEEARDGLKKLNAKKGPRFDLLASPVNKSAVNLDMSNKKSNPRPKRTIPTKPGSSGFPWVPPPRDGRSGGVDDGDEEMDENNQD